MFTNIKSIKNMTQEDIREINLECPSSEQGIFKEPFGIPNHIKEPVIYMRWVKGGIEGGSCWGTERTQRESEPKPKFMVLDLVLKKLKPDLTFLQFRDIEYLIHSTEKKKFGITTETIMNILSNILFCLNLKNY